MLNTPAILASLLAVFLIVSIASGPLLFPYLLVRWTLEAGKERRDAAAARAAGTACLMVFFALLFAWPYIPHPRPGPATTVLRDALLSMAVSPLLVLAVVAGIRWARSRRAGSSAGGDPATLVRRRHLCALALVLVALALFGASMLHAAVVGWDAHRNMFHTGGAIPIMGAHPVRRE